MSERKWTRRATALVLTASVVLPVLAADPTVPAPLQANILLRMLGYDRSLRTRAGSSVGIGIVFEPSDKGSTRWHEDMLRAFEALQPQTVQGSSFVVLGHPYKDAAALADFVDKKGIDALYVSPGLEDDLEAIRAVCQEKKVASIGATRTAVEKGVAVAVVAKGDSPRILVHLPTAQALGMELDPKLLLLADVIR